MAIQDNLALHIPVLLDVIVLDHKDLHIHLIKEQVKIQYLVLHKDSVCEEGIDGLERTGQAELRVITQFVSGKYNTWVCQTNAHLITI